MEITLTEYLEKKRDLFIECQSRYEAVLTQIEKNCFDPASVTACETANKALVDFDAKYPGCRAACPPDMAARFAAWSQLLSALNAKATERLEVQKNITFDSIKDVIKAKKVAQSDYAGDRGLSMNWAVTG